MGLALMRRRPGRGANGRSDGGGGGGSFDPANLSPIVWFDATFAEGIFTDVAGTIPSTVNGGANNVKRITNRGSAGDATDPASRALDWASDESGFYFVHGSADYLDYTLENVEYGSYLLMAFAGSVTTNGGVFGVNAGTLQPSLIFSGTNGYQMPLGGSGYPHFGVVAVNTDVQVVVAQGVVGGAMSMRRNGVEIATGTAGATGMSGGARRIGWAASAGSAGRIYQAIQVVRDTPLSLATVQALEAWLAARCGVEL
jgi:hypothetical protein